MLRTKSDTVAVDSYLASLPKEDKEVLEKLRRLIKELVPHVEERISYGAAVMFSTKYDLFGFVAQKNHLSFLTASPKLAEDLKSEIVKTHKLSGATIHFSVENPIPNSLIKKIITARVKENEKRTLLKKGGVEK